MIDPRCMYSRAIWSLLEEAEKNNRIDTEIQQSSKDTIKPPTQSKRWVLLSLVPTQGNDIQKLYFTDWTFFFRNLNVHVSSEIVTFNFTNFIISWSSEFVYISDFNSRHAHAL